MIPRRNNNPVKDQEKRWSDQSTERSDRLPATPPALSGTTGSDEPGAKSSPFRMGLVVSLSALCGGIAVALWNRHLLAKLRDQRPAPEPTSSFWDDDV